MNYFVRILVIGMVITGAAASAFSNHSVKAVAPISHQINTSSSLHPGQLCTGHDCW